MRTWMFFAVVANLGLIGCGSTVIDDDGGGGEGGSSCLGADCDVCPGQPPRGGSGCDLPDMTECRYGVDPGVDCQEVFRCEPVYPEAGAPSEWVSLGQEGAECAQCTAVPVCDPGDTEVSECPLDASCYAAEMCGSTITCMDSGLPEHGCPETKPVHGTNCSVGFTECSYPTTPGCFETYFCGDEGWEFVGGGCEAG